ncbi:MAG: hypothetical protein A4E48_02241 [Methanosaeta sp. PtaU1.Bin060]|jgi:predicted transcriptional regulator|nr:MAG: hypothetical protein A4E48_02241 [Methanosaeta sp. PtaU1.Bin060]
MKSEVHISKDLEKAIIMCLKETEFKLPSRTIVEYAKKYVKDTDGNIERKIQRMAKKGLLSHDIDAHKKYIYYLNPENDFTLEGLPLKLLKDTRKDATSAKVTHFSALKDAIRTWRDNLSEPNPGFPSAEDIRNSAVIAACEGHTLFQDLDNHLPGLSIDACKRWDDYKKGLMELDGLKQNLLSELGAKILDCFEGMNLRFVNGEEHHYLADYECTLTPHSLYDIVLALELSDESYNNHERFHSWLQNNAPLIEEGDHLLLGDVVRYLRAPKKDRASLEAGIPRFLSFVESLPDSEFSIKAANIIAKANMLKHEREQILQELDHALQYANFPGECKYLK